MDPAFSLAADGDNASTNAGERRLVKMRRRSAALPSRRYLAVGVTAVLGTLCTIAALVLVLWSDYRVAAIDLQSNAKSFLDIVNADLAESATTLYTLGGYVGTNEGTLRQRDFEQFSRVLDHRTAGLRETAWAPRTSAGRAAYTVRFAAGIRAAEIRPGFDIDPASARSSTIARALQTDQPAATGPLNVGTIEAPQRGVIGYLPVGIVNDGSGRSRLPKGIVLGVFEVAATLNAIVARTGSNGLNLYVFDPATQHAQRVLYWHSTTAALPLPPTERSLLGEPHWQGAIWMLDRRLGALVTPSTPIRFWQWSWHALSVLLGGLTMTGMTVAFLRSSLRRERKLEAVTASLRDATASLHRDAEESTHIARHDALTGLPNRLLFGERMQEAIARLSHNLPFSVMGLDLDHFKAVNDTLGHGMGDQLLCAVAERLRRCMRGGDTVARLGGDEFAIILAGTINAATIAIVAERLIREVGQPYVIDEHTIVIGLSVGVATSHSGATAQTLLAEADLALYEAKQQGRATFRFFESDLRTRAEEKRRLETELRQAFARNEFELYYQPIVNIADLRVVAFEALLRWNHPDRGLVPPGDFLSLAHELGMMVALGFWVVETACEEATRWPASIKVTVNVSPEQFSDPGLLASIEHCLTRSDLPANRLEIEITEAAVLDEQIGAAAILTGLRRIGVTVALDDFGTGFSALSTVARFSFDTIKIDRSFVAEMESSPSAGAIVRAVAGLGANLGIVTTGEGVETAAQLERLRKAGCMEAQGDFFSPARPSADVPLLLGRFEATTHLAALSSPAGV